MPKRSARTRSSECCANTVSFSSRNAAVMPNTRQSCQIQERRWSNRHCAASEERTAHRHHTLHHPSIRPDSAGLWVLKWCAHEQRPPHEKTSLVRAPPIGWERNQGKEQGPPFAPAPFLEHEPYSRKEHDAGNACSLAPSPSRFPFPSSCADSEIPLIPSFSPNGGEGA